eukprot:gene11052-11207_t
MAQLPQLPRRQLCQQARSVHLLLDWASVRKRSIRTRANAPGSGSRNAPFWPWSQPKSPAVDEFETEYEYVYVTDHGTEDAHEKQQQARSQQDENCAGAAAAPAEAPQPEKVYDQSDEAIAHVRGREDHLGRVRGDADRLDVKALQARQQESRVQ